MHLTQEVHADADQSQCHTTKHPEGCDNSLPDPPNHPPVVDKLPRGVVKRVPVAGADGLQMPLRAMENLMPSRLFKTDRYQ